MTISYKGYLTGNKLLLPPQSSFKILQISSSSFKKHKIHLLQAILSLLCFVTASFNFASVMLMQAVRRNRNIYNVRVHHIARRGRLKGGRHESARKVADKLKRVLRAREAAFRNLRHLVLHMVGSTSSGRRMYYYIGEGSEVENKRAFNAEMQRVFGRSFAGRVFFGIEQGHWYAASPLLAGLRRKVIILSYTVPGVNYSTRCLLWLIWVCLKVQMNVPFQNYEPLRWNVLDQKPHPHCY